MNAPIRPYYEHAGITIYHGDAREIVPKLDPVDLVLTDPPYGIGWSGHNASDREWREIENDAGAMDLRFVLNLPSRVISFGANCYPDQLPHRGRWIVWDKRVDPRADKMLGSPFELAWTNQVSGFDRIYRIQHGGVVNADGRSSDRVHPTQKPISLMYQILRDYGGETVLDPFLGSGTILIAAKQLGRRAIGIEIDERYCKVAVDRLAQDCLYSAEQQEEPEPVQASLLDPSQ